MAAGSTCENLSVNAGAVEPRKTAGLLKRDESPVRIRHNWLSPVKATPKLPAVVVATVLQNLVDLVVNPMERTTQVRLQLKDL